MESLTNASTSPGDLIKKTDITIRSSPESLSPESNAQNWLNNSTTLVCSFPNCSIKTAFTRNSEFKKHIDRHNRPYKCHRPGCAASAFGDAGGLYRHQREVHRTQEGDRPITEFLCPEPNCERHKRGFPRRWNLMEHQRRVHGLDKEAWNDDTRVLKRVKRSESSSSISSLPSPSPSDEPDDSTRSSVQTSVSVVRNRKEGLTSNLRSALRDMESQRSMLDNQRRKLAQDIDDMKRMLHRYGDEDPERSSQTL